MDFFDDRRRRPRRRPVMQIMNFAVGYYDTDPTRSLRTWVLACAEGRLYIAMKNGGLDPRRLIMTDPSTWSDPRGGVPPVEFLPSSLWPRASSSYHRYSARGGDDSSLVYKKYKSPLEMVLGHPGAWREITENTIHKLISQREIETCEILRRYPHPNLAKYKGVECRSEIVTRRPDSTEIGARFDTERVITLVFKRYSSSLEAWVLAGKPISLTDCLTSIVKGIKHMHSLGLVHCDIKPENIFVDGSNPRRISYVVGDFDSTAPTGTIYDLKGGDLRFSINKRFHIDRVEKDDDWYAFEKTKQWLIRQLGRRERDYRHIGGPGWALRF